MSIDHTVFKLNYELMLNNMYPFEGIVDQDGILRCKLTWVEAKAKSGFLQRLIKQSKEKMYRGKIIWFQEGDPYKGSKPFNILWVGLDNLASCNEPVIVVLVVSGKKTDRIEKKWSGKLAVIFGYPVNIIWEEDAQ